MTSELSSEDETYKYFLKKLKVRFHRRTCGDGEYIELLNVEQIPASNEHKYMDGHYSVDGKYRQNMEFQSTPVYAQKMIAIFMYMVFALAELFTEFHTCIVATYPPTQGITELKIGDVLFSPKFYFTKKQKASEIIKTVSDKNNSKTPLTDNEAIDLLIAPDMTHNYDIKELLQTTTTLLLEAVIPDKEFHRDLLECQRKVLKRFLKSDDRKEIENMMNLKSITKELGIEPNVTGFEESMNLAYLDGKRDGEEKGIIQTAKNLIKRGFDDEIILEVTELDSKTLQKLKKD